jgi:hypothetical protein
VEEEQEDLNDPPELSVVVVEARVHQETIYMFQSALLFSKGVAKALYDNQMIMTLDVLRDLNNNTIKDIARTIRKPGGDTQGLQISELSVSYLKIFAFWARHMWQTSRSVDNWTEMTWKDIKFLGPQKLLEDSLLDTKEPKSPTMTLDPLLAAKAFTNMVVHLGKRQGITGIPLAYVMHCTLKGPNGADIDDEPKDPPSFGQLRSIYFYIDNKLIAWAPILHHDLINLQLAASLETLKSDGPFEPSFLTNMVMVYNILQSYWGKSGWWSHMKKFSKSKNGCQVYHTLHTVLLGGQQVVPTGAPLAPSCNSSGMKASARTSILTSM